MEAVSVTGVIRRFALRADGFVAINAPLSGGELLTRPLIFDGARLLLNMSTSGAGCLRIEIQDPAGTPLPGFALADGPDMVGVNNRNLSTFQIDLSFAERVIPHMPKSVLKVAESGIKTAEDAARMRAAGADALLVGESLMRAADPAALMKALQSA